jgi:pseudouridine-5'-phosphate glycosidase
MDAQIEAAVALADRNGIRGRALTPFLLAEIARRTGGKSLAANRALLVHTARFAGELAVADARLRSIKN